MSVKQCDNLSGNYISLQLSRQSSALLRRLSRVQISLGLPQQRLTSAEVETMKTSLDSTEETCNEICRCSVIGNTSLFQSDIAGSCPVTDSSERTSLSMRSTAISRWQSDMCIQTDCDQRVFDERKWELSLQRSDGLCLQLQAHYLNFC